MDLNKDDNRRQEILGLDIDWSGNWGGGIARFEDATSEQIKTLLDEKFADPDDCQNSSPTYQEMLEFMESNPDFVAHGYVVSPSRSDYRVTIEGIKLDRKPTSDELTDFVTMFRHADEFDVGESCYCWFD